MNNQNVKVAYFSEWEEGLVETTADLNLKTGSVTGIEVSAEGAQYESLIREYIKPFGSDVSAEVEPTPDGEYGVVSLDDLASLNNHFQQMASSEPSTDFVIRHVVTVPHKNGFGRVMMHACQGRYTYATPEEAQAWIDGYLSNNSQSILDEFGRDLQVRPCKCYPGHFDPMGIYFDQPDAKTFVENLNA